MRFTIRLADIPISVETVYERCHRLCKGYLTDETPTIEVKTTVSDIEAERARPDGSSGSDPYLETLAVYRKIAEQLVKKRVILFHGSAVSADGKAYLFTADSGTGKSTHTRLWREQLTKLGHEVVMINDDKPLLKFEDGVVYACGTPWNGKHRLGSNIMVPLHCVCRLSRGKENFIRPADGNEALPWLMQYCFRPEDTGHVRSTILLLDELSRTVPLYELSCNMEPEAALISFEGMRGND